MATDLGPKFTKTFTGKPAHMSPEDFIIFQRWFPTVRADIDSVYFDVGLGLGKPLQTMPPPNYQRMWERLTQKRADVVFTSGQLVTIVEIRFAANANAVGRLLLYQHAYLQDPVLGDNLKLQLVTDLYDDDILTICEHAGIIYTIA